MTSSQSVTKKQREEPTMPNDNSQLTSATPMAKHAEKPRSVFRRALPWAGAVVGGIIIGALVTPGGGGTPAPAETVTVAAPSAVDPTCQTVAVELWSILQSYNNDVTLPVLNASAGAFDAIAAGDAAGVEAQLPIIYGANDALTGLTDRIEVVGPDYQACTAAP